MKLLSSEEYQDRINPWLNKNVHVAHGIPVSFPHFRSPLASEAFLLVLAIALFAVMYVGFSLLFSLLGLSNGESVVDSLVATLKKSQALILFSLFVLTYFRLAYFFLGKLDSESLVAVSGFLMIMSLPFIAGLMPVFESWINSKPINYESQLNSGLFVFLPVAYVISQKLLRQFNEAKNKKAALAH